MDGENIVRLPVTVFDPKLMNAFRGESWNSSKLAVADVLASAPISLSVLVWRLRELIAAGRLEARGDENDIGLPSELRQA